jgi:hypothetical protein
MLLNQCNFLSLLLANYVDGERVTRQKKSRILGGVEPPKNPEQTTSQTQDVLSKKSKAFLIGIYFFNHVISLI